MGEIEAGGVRDGGRGRRRQSRSSVNHLVILSFNLITMQLIKVQQGADSEHDREHRRL